VGWGERIVAVTVTEAVTVTGTGTVAVPVPVPVPVPDGWRPGFDSVIRSVSGSGWFR
jgi:hypothetical protein